MTAKRPNILMIVVDSARFDRLGIHGYARAKTPVIDSFARSAVDHTNANAPAGSTRPSMASIFTALYPHAYGFADGKFPGESHVMMPQRFKAAGYRTYLYSNNPYVSPATGLDRGCDVVRYVNRSNVLSSSRRSVLLRHLPDLARAICSPNASLKPLSDLLTTEACRSINDHRRTDTPFFIYVHLDVHHPYLTDRRYLRKFLPSSVTKSDVAEVERLQRAHPNMSYFVRDDLPEERKVRYHLILNAMYDASLAKCDQQVGRLLKALWKHGSADDTAVVITSDHGEFIGERGLFSHGAFPYDGSMRVPLLIRFPGAAIQPGQSRRLTSTIDIAPTLFDLAGLAGDTGTMQGISTLSDRQHEFVMNERRNFSEGYDAASKRFPGVSLERFDLGNIVAVKDERYKYVWTSKGPEFLFDLVNDPGERRNLAEDQSERLAAYRGRFEAWRAAVSVTPGAEDETYEEEILTHLRDLGYVE